MVPCSRFIWITSFYRYRQKKQGPTVLLNLERMTHKSVLELDVTGVYTDAGAAQIF